MSFALTPYSLEEGLKFLFTALSVTRPTAWYVARHIGTTDDTGSTNEETTGNDADYTRLPVTFNISSWSSALQEQVCESSSSLTFTPASGAGTRTYYALSVWDASTGGNCLFVVNFENYTVDASNSNPLILPVGELIVSMYQEVASTGITSSGMQMILDWLFTIGSVTRPTEWHVSMHTADPGADGSANELTVGVDANYTRKSLTFGTPVSISGQQTECRNNSSVSWTPAVGTIYTIPYFGIFNASSTGTCLSMHGAESPKSAPSVILLNVNQLSVWGKE